MVNSPLERRRRLDSATSGPGPIGGVIPVGAGLGSRGGGPAGGYKAVRGGSQVLIRGNVTQLSNRTNGQVGNSVLTYFT